MPFVVCCATMEVKFRKRGGGCKVVNDNAIQVSEVDGYLNEIMKKNNFKEFISVKITNIHQRPLHSADSDDSDEEKDVENEEVVTSNSVDAGNETRSVSPAVSVGQ